MKVLELFAGSMSFSNVAKEYGHDIFSSDFANFENIDYQVDILNFDVNRVPFIPDIIWASPPCTTFSVASIGKHWERGDKAHIPKTKQAKEGIEYIKKTLYLIQVFKPKYWYIENPRGMLRTMPFMQNLPIRHTVTYCQYGDTRMKPTDIWTNNDNWKPKPSCKNGDKCHVAAPRGSKTGTQGLKNNYYRSKIPNQLCEEIIKASCL